MAKKRELLKGKLNLFELQHKTMQWLKQIAPPPKGTRLDMTGDPLWFCKKLNFDRITIGYWHKPKSFLMNEMHKILWDFDI